MIMCSYLEKILAAAVCFMSMKSFKEADASTKGTVAPSIPCRMQCIYECCGDSSLCGSVMFRRLFILTILCVLMVCSGCDDANMIKRDRKNCRGGRIFPRDPFFLSGELITLECSSRGINRTARHFTFEWGMKPTKVPPEYISQISSSTIQVKMPKNETMSMIEKRQGTRQVKCIKSKNGDKKCKDNIYIEVDYYPETPVNVSCRIYMNELGTMNCSWDLVRLYLHPQHMNVGCDFAALNHDRVDVSYLSDSEHGTAQPCPHLGRTWCYWNEIDFTDPYSTLLKVTVTNTRRNVSNSTAWLKFNTDDIVEPGPVKHLRVTKNKESPRCLTLRWEPVKLFRDFVFNVTYRSNCSQMQTKSVTYKSPKEIRMSQQQNVTLCELIPHRNYTFWVQGRLLKPSDNYAEIGFWSKAESISDQTLPDEIDVAPKTAPGLYELTTTADQSRLIIVYWTPLSDCDLHDDSRAVKYYVQVNDTIEYKNHSAFYTIIRVPDVKVVNVSIGATNSVGSTAAPEVITVYSEAPRASELIVECNQTSGVSAVHASIVTKESGAQYTDLKHTVVWCKGNAQFIVCSSPLQWQELDSNRTDFLVPVPQCDGYRYGLVTHGYHQDEGQMISTGIQWQPCLYLLGKVPDKPLESVSVQSISESSFTVKWAHPVCQDTKVYIANYTVKYCITGDKNTCQCEGELKSHSVPNTNDTFTATNLIAGTDFCVWVAAAGKYGQGPWSDKVATRTVQDNTDSSVWRVIIVILIALVVIAVIIAVGVICYRRYRRIKKRSGVTLPDRDMFNPSLVVNGFMHSGGEADDNFETSGNVTDDHNYSSPLTESTRLATSTSEHMQQLPGHNERAPLLPDSNGNAVLLQGNNEHTLWPPTDNSGGSLDDSESQYSALTGYEDPQEINTNYSPPVDCAMKSMSDSVVYNFVDNAEQSIHTEQIQADRDTDESEVREIPNSDEEGVHELSADSEVVSPVKKCGEMEFDSHFRALGHCCDEPQFSVSIQPKSSEINHTEQSPQASSNVTFCDSLCNISDKSKERTKNAASLNYHRDSQASWTDIEMKSLCKSQELSANQTISDQTSGVEVTEFNDDLVTDEDSYKEVPDNGSSECDSESGMSSIISHGLSILDLYSNFMAAEDLEVFAESAAENAGMTSDMSHSPDETEVDLVSLSSAAEDYRQNVFVSDSYSVEKSENSEEMDEADDYYSLRQTENCETVDEADTQCDRSFDHIQDSGNNFSSLNDIIAEDGDPFQMSGKYKVTKYKDTEVNLSDIDGSVESVSDQSSDNGTRHSGMTDVHSGNDMASSNVTNSTGSERLPEYVEGKGNSGKTFQPSLKSRTENVQVNEKTNYTDGVSSHKQKYCQENGRNGFKN